MTTQITIPIVGWIDATTDDLKVHLPPELLKNTFAMFFVGMQQYRKDADGQLYKVYPADEAGKVTLVAVDKIDPADRTGSN